MNSLNSLTYEQKISFLIDVSCNSREDFDGMNEKEIEQIIIDNDDVAECLQYNS